MKNKGCERDVTIHRHMSIESLGQIEQCLHINNHRGILIRRSKRRGMATYVTLTYCQMHSVLNIGGSPQSNGRLGFPVLSFGGRSGDAAVFRRSRRVAFFLRVLLFLSLVLFFRWTRAAFGALVCLRVNLIHRTRA